MSYEDEKILLRWKAKNRIKNNTFEIYKSVIQHFLRCTQMSVTELYNEAIEDEENMVPRYRKKINNHILDYYNYLDTTELSESTKSMHIYVLKSFYNSFDIELPKILNRYDDKPDPRNVDKNITKDLIKLMLQTANTRDKSIISFAAMTGQSPDEIRSITIKKLMNCYNTELSTKIFTINDIFKNRDEILSLEAPRLDMIRSKTNNRYWVYIPSETSKYIIDYLYERVNGTNKKIKPSTLDGYLFVNKMGDQFSSEALGKIFISLGKKCGFETPENFNDELRLLLERDENNHRVWKAYNFRKFFINTCRRYAGTRLDSHTEFVFSGRELADFWVGHVPKGSIKHYLQYNTSDIDEMQQQYLQALPYLSIETEVRTVTSDDKKEFEKMKNNYNDVLNELQLLKEYMRSKEVVEKWKKNH